MEKYVVAENHQTNVFGRLVDSIQSTDNIIDIFGEATSLLDQTIKCDYVNFLFHNEKARYFYIDQALNQTGRENGSELIIPYNETSLTEILRSHASVVRSDLSIRGNLTPGDLKFLTEGIKSDLSVPIILKNRILAVINLSSFESHFFTESHQGQVEQVASVLGLALARIELIEKLDKKESDLLGLKNKFKSLINNIDESVAVVRSDYDLIYETNRALQKLTGYSSEDLRGIQLSQLHPQNKESILNQLDKSMNNGKETASEQVFLTCKDGTILPVKLKFVPIRDKKTNFVYALYERTAVADEPDQKNEELEEEDSELIAKQVAIFSEMTALACLPLNLNDLVKAALVAVQKVVTFDYAQVALFDSSGEKIESHTVISDPCRIYDADKNWSIVAGCDFFWYHFKVGELKQQIEKNANGFEKIETELQSTIPAVLTTRHGNIGFLVLGSLKANFYQKYHTDFIKKIAGLISLLIDKERLLQKDEESKVNRSIQSDLFRMNGKNLHLNHVLSNIVRLSTEKMQSQLATIRLFEDDRFLPEIIVSDPRCDKAVLAKFERENIIPEFNATNQHDLTGNISNEYFDAVKGATNPAHDFRTYFTTILKSGENTIGMLTHYWKPDCSIDSDNRRLARAIANQAAEAIGNAKLFQESLIYCEQLEISTKESQKFIENISNDLKMPLVSIQGFSSTLLNNLDEKASEEDLKYLQKIKTHTINLKKHIDGLMELTRVSQVVRPFENVHIADIIDKAINQLDETIQLHRIRVNIDRALPIVYGDGNLLCRVYFNLIDIFIKNIGEHNKRPKIDLGFQQEIGDERFFIRNNNVKIRKEMFENMFDLNYPGEEGMDQKSYGLSLEIVKKILELHNGQIWFESEQGKGGCFYFCIPVKKY